jgi:hypothetical protein
MGKKLMGKITPARMNKIKAWAAEQKKSQEEYLAKLNRVLDGTATNDEMRQADFLLRTEEWDRKKNSPKHRAKINKLLWALLETIGVPGVPTDCSARSTKRTTEHAEER